MIRSTTPTHIFSFENIDPSTFKILNIYYAQQGVEILKKIKMIVILVLKKQKMA